ncbi:MAG TPA: hypothetical protein VGH54_26510 [Mycobacterium sp.]|jgi:hypothetical protein|uniref:hypothetical protein n=1 Tax=Mycobacterium sp. TaxID=1785 RepID=UPI002F42923A
MTEFGFFATALMVLLYAAGVLAVVVIGACVLPRVIRQRPKRVEAAESETAYLLRSPANARRLLASIDSLENGNGEGRPLRKTS